MHCLVSRTWSTSLAVRQLTEYRHDGSQSAGRSPAATQTTAAIISSYIYDTETTGGG